MIYNCGEFFDLLQQIEETERSYTEGEVLNEGVDEEEEEEEEEEDGI